MLARPGTCDRTDRDSSRCREDGGDHGPRRQTGSRSRNRSAPRDVSRRLAAAVGSPCGVGARRHAPAGSRGVRHQCVLLNGGGTGSTRVSPVHDIVLGRSCSRGRRWATTEPTGFNGHGYKIPVTLPEGPGRRCLSAELAWPAWGLVFSLTAQDSGVALGRARLRPPPCASRRARAARSQGRTGCPADSSSNRPPLRHLGGEGRRPALGAAARPARPALLTSRLSSPPARVEERRPRRPQKSLPRKGVRVRIPPRYCTTARTRRDPLGRSELPRP